MKVTRTKVRLNLTVGKLNQLTEHYLFFTYRSERRKLEITSRREVKLWKV